MSVQPLEPLPPDVTGQLVSIERFTFPQLMEDHILPAAKADAAVTDACGEFVPAMTVFEGVPLEPAFDYLARTQHLAEWTLSLRNVRLLRDDIFVGDEVASPSGRVYMQSVSNRSAFAIGWNCSHTDPDDLWLQYRGLLVDAATALGRPGTAFFWMNFVHDRVKSDPVYAQGFKLMFSVHRLEIQNLKKVVEYRFGAPDRAPDRPSREDSY
ncbi:MAG: hypothetical protein ACOC1F_08410 [Myxococcota bacterium]